MNNKTRALLLDDRNADLWAKVSKSMNISVSISNRQLVSSVSIYGNMVDIIVSSYPKSKIESFTHELLHVYMAKLGINFGPDLKLSIRNSNGSRLSSILLDNIIDGINNSLEHMKMFPLYLDLGYDRSKFLADYDHDMITIVEKLRLKYKLKKIRIFRKKAKYNITNTQLYILKFLAMKVCFNPDKNYTKPLNMLYKIDPMLYNILNQLIEEWDSYNYRSGTKGAGYQPIKENLLNRLKEWASNKDFY